MRETPLQAVLFSGDTRMHNLSSQWVARRCFGDRFGKVASTTRGSD